MLRNYIKIAFRTLARNKLHTAINILGLAIGISACFTIFQIVKYEKSFDTFHPEKEQIYRVYTQFSGTSNYANEGVCMPLAPAIEEQVIAVELVAPIYTMYRVKAIINSGSAKKETFKDLETVAFMSPAFFEIFSSYEWLSGSPETALAEPNQVVLSESAAMHYFGLKDATTAIGETIVYQDSLSVMVSGIVADLKQPSDFIFTDFISYSTLENSWMKEEVPLTEWNSFYSNTQLFVKKRVGASEEQIMAQFDAVLLQNSPPEEDDNGDATNFKLQPLSDMHGNTELNKFPQSAAAVPRSTLYALMSIAGILLLIASINFINLSTAQSLQRSKEVGVRKVLGSDRGHLIKQFLSETTLLTTVAVALSVVFSQASFHYFQEFLPEGLSFQLFEPSTLLFLGSTIVVVSLLSGFYPAFILSSFLPIVALKNQKAQLQEGNSSNWIRQGLIVLQFGMALILISGTFIVGEQLQYMLNKDLGFHKDAIVYLYTSWRQPAEKKALLRAKIAQLPEVENISLHNAPPSRRGHIASNFLFDVNGAQETHHIKGKIIDENYLDLYGIELVAGRELLPSDTTKEYLINEEFVKLMGFDKPEDAIGKVIKKGRTGGYPVIGVVKNFHHQDLRTKIEPLIMNMDKRTYCMGMKLNTKDMPATMLKMKAIWQSIYPEVNFNPHFFDETIAKQYESEQRTAKLMRTATGVAIFISCIGLFGLVSFSVARRTREIGIRKVLGASVPSIVALLSKDFIVLVIVAILLASPIAWWLSQTWLSDFAYRIELKWWMFALAGLSAICIAFLTVSFQSIKAALANPIESLRNE